MLLYWHDLADIGDLRSLSSLDFLFKALLVVRETYYWLANLWIDNILLIVSTDFKDLRGISLSFAVGIVSRLV